MNFSSSHPPPQNSTHTASTPYLQHIYNHRCRFAFLLSPLPVPLTPWSRLALHPVVDDGIEAHVQRVGAEGGRQPGHLS